MVVVCTNPDLIVKQERVSRSQPFPDICTDTHKAFSYRVLRAISVRRRSHAFAPVRADGSLLTTPGYDPQTQLLFKPDGEHFPEIPEHPSKEDAQRALEAVKQAIATFPFSAEADRSVALSLLLTGVCRRTLDFAPLHAITAPAPGTGKSLLIDLASILLSGQPAPVLSAEIDAAEFEKRLGASLMSRRRGDLVR